MFLAARTVPSRHNVSLNWYQLTPCFLVSPLEKRNASGASRSCLGLLSQSKGKQVIIIIISIIIIIIHL
jgi:hypothetical protein